MKKSLFMLGLAVAALASCTNEEVTDIADSNVIGFGKAFVGNVTKVATEVNVKNLQSFYVYAYEDNSALLSNENVYLQNGLWAYDNIKKYNSSATYAFAAYSDGGTAKGEGSLTGVSFTQTDTKTLSISDYTCDGTKDLLVSISPDNLEDANKAVDFTFSHALAMIKFTIKSGMGNDQKLTISDFKVEDSKIQNNGDLTYTTTASWTLDGTATYATLEGMTSADATTETGAEAIYTVIPQEVADGFTVTFKATITPTGESATAIEKSFTATVKADNAKWTAGNRYNYILTITGTDMDVIEFAAPQVDSWNEQTGVDIEPSVN